MPKHLRVGKIRRLHAPAVDPDQPPFQAAEDSTSAAVPKNWPGSTIVILGGGPSLVAEDVEYCRHRAGAVVVINDGYKLAPWANVLYAADSQWWRWHRGVMDFAGMRFTLQREATRWGVKLLRNTGPSGLELDPRGLRTGENGGYQAINLAVHMGAKRILLLGYDMRLGPGGRGHWFGEHPGTGHVHSNYARFLPWFDSLVAPLAAAGVEVINCTPVSALETFPKRPLREVL